MGGISQSLIFPLSGAGQVFSFKARSASGISAATSVIRNFYFIVRLELNHRTFNDPTAGCPLNNCHEKNSLVATERSFANAVNSPHPFSFAVRPPSRALCAAGAVWPDGSRRLGRRKSGPGATTVLRCGPARQCLRVPRFPEPGAPRLRPGLEAERREPRGARDPAGRGFITRSPVAAQSRHR